MARRRGDEPAIRVERVAEDPRRYPWPPRAVALLGTIPDAAVASRLGLCLATVRKERHRREIAPFKPRRPRVEWTEEMVELLGTEPDAAIAERLRIGKASVARKRQLLGIESYTPPLSRRPGRRWRTDELAMLGKSPDSVVARRLGVSATTVARKRQRLGIASYCKPVRPIDWTSEMVALLGRSADAEVARRYGIAQASVQAKRRALEIPPFREERPIVRRPELAELARLPVAEASRRSGVAEDTIRALRDEYGVQGADGRDRWTAEQVARLGTRCPTPSSRTRWVLRPVRWVAGGAPWGSRR